MRSGQQWFGDKTGWNGNLLMFWKVLEVDSQLLALFVEVAALQSECFSGLRDVPSMPLQLRQHSLPLEGQHPLRQWTCCVFVELAHCCSTGPPGRKSQADIFRFHLRSGQQQQALYDIP